MMTHEDGLHPSMLGFIQDPNPNPNPNLNPNPNPISNPSKRKRNLPGTPDPDAEVIALSPKSLMATNRFLCEICNKGFQRDQNLQLHRRGHNLPWKLKQRSNKEVKKKVYICPETSCVHHDASRALGDLTGIKKHFSRKHGEKKWKCEKCSKKYAVHSDWKAHSKICGTREYKCDCGTLFSRKDSFITHRAFCDALAEETARFSSPVASANLNFRNEFMTSFGNPQFSGMFRAAELGGGSQLNLDLQKPRLPVWLDGSNSSNLSGSSLPELVQMAAAAQNGQQWFGRGQLGQEGFAINATAPSSSSSPMVMMQIPRVMKEEEENKGSFSEAITSSSLYYNHNQNQSQSHEAAGSSNGTSLMSATALLQKAAQMGSTRAAAAAAGFGLMSSFSDFNSDTAANLGKPESLSSLTRDFLGVGGNELENRQFMEESELAKFASMGGSGAMDMGGYSRNH